MSLNIKIVKSINEYNKGLNERIEKGLIKKPESGMVMTPETFSKVFSPERIKLLQRIYRNKINNIYQLARELGKPYEVVFRNIKYLEGIGLVKITDKDNKKIPQLTSKLNIDMFSE